LPCHCNCIHMLILHINLFIASLFNQSDGPCYLMRTLQKDLRHWKDSSFGGDYF
jgi:hypothetical protein